MRLADLRGSLNCYNTTFLYLKVISPGLQDVDLQFELLVRYFLLAAHDLIKIRDHIRPLVGED